MDACGVETKVVLPDTSQISEDAKTKFNLKINEFMEARAPIEKKTAEDKPVEKIADKPVVKPAPVSPRGLVGGALPSLPSRMEVEQAVDEAFTHKNASPPDNATSSPLAVGSPDSILLNATPLSESGTKEVANTPNTADVAEEKEVSNDMDDIPDTVPIMISVVSETGDEMLHIESPKKSAKKESAPSVEVEPEPAVDSTPN